MHPATRLQVTSISRHWNGHPMRSYHVVAFHCRHESRMLDLQAVVFHDRGRVAVLGCDLPGDEFEAHLRREIAAWERKNG